MNKEVIRIVKFHEIEILSDNKYFTNRFKIKGLSDTGVLLIGQSKDNQKWTCSCNKWKKKTGCDHLDTIKPFLIKIEAVEKAKNQ